MKKLPLALVILGLAVIIAMLVGWHEYLVHRYEGSGDGA